jgi:dTDP-L-rhamnose 4-epimerase
MRINRVLVTGGAGFIGAHVVGLLHESKYELTVLDNLDPQVHGSRKKALATEGPTVSYIIDDIRNKEKLATLLKEADAVIHLAATVGVGQSMYEIERYIDSNTRGTATLMDLLVNLDHNVEKLVIASSMSVYGEGKYYCEKCESPRTPDLRTFGHETSINWEHKCKTCGASLRPVPTDEDTPLRPTSIYAMSKRHQEEMSLLVGKTYGIPTVALRFFNACGPGQSLSNPYTGAAAIFMSRIMNGQPPYIFEDGEQLRDFVHVKDIARACHLALESNEANYLPVNVGTGKPTSILRIAETLIDLHGVALKPRVTNEFRKGDIRHCYADTNRAKKLLKFEANFTFRDALSDLVQWTKTEGGKNAVDMFDRALNELRKRNLA